MHLSPGGVTFSNPYCRLGGGSNPLRLMAVVLKGFRPFHAEQAAGHGGTRRDTAGQGQDEKLTTNQRWVCYVVVEELKLSAISPLPSRRGGGTRRDKAAGQGGGTRRDTDRAGTGRTGIGLRPRNPQGNCPGNQLHRFSILFYGSFPP